MNGHHTDGLPVALVQARMQFEQEVLHILRGLPVPIVIIPQSDGLYIWQVRDAIGAARSFLDALSSSIAYTQGNVSSASNVDILRKEKQRRIDEGETT